MSQPYQKLNSKNKKLKYTWLISAIWAKATLSYYFAPLNTLHLLSSHLPTPLLPHLPLELPLWKQSCILSLDYLRNITYFKMVL